MSLHFSSKAMAPGSSQSSSHLFSLCPDPNFETLHEERDPCDWWQGSELSTEAPRAGPHACKGLYQLSCISRAPWFYLSEKIVRALFYLRIKTMETSEKAQKAHPHCPSVHLSPFTISVTHLSPHSMSCVGSPIPCLSMYPLHPRCSPPITPLLIPKAHST